MTKKTFGILLALAILNFVLTFFLSVESVALNDEEFSFPFTNKVYNDLQEVEPNTPGAGEYALIAGGGSLLLDFFSILIYVIILAVLPNTFPLIVTVLMLIALLFQIGKPQKWKIITGMALIFISIALEAIELFILVFFILANILLITIAIITNFAFVAFLIYNAIRLSNELKK